MSTSGLGFSKSRTKLHLLPPVDRKVQEAILEEGSAGMRVLEVVRDVPELQASPVGEVVRRLSDGLAQRGHLVNVVSSPHVGSVQLGRHRFFAPFARWGEIRDSLDNYDIIHVHGPAPTFSDVFLLLFTGFGAGSKRGRVVYTYHYDPTFLGQPGLVGYYGRLQKRLARLAGHTVVTTPYYAYDLRPHVATSERLSVIPWGVDASEYRWPPHKAAGFHVLFVDQIFRAPGLNTLLQAAGQVAGMRLHVVVGRRETEEWLRRVNVLSSDQVTIYVQADAQTKRALFEQAHVLVLPSVEKMEAFGLLPMEGMAAGCVLVSSDRLQDVSDLIGRVGFTYPEGNSEGLARLLSELRDHPDVCERYSRLARQRAELYPWSRTIDAYERLLSLIHARRLIRFASQRAESRSEFVTWLLRHLINLTKADSGDILRAEDSKTLTVESVVRRPWHVGQSLPANEGLHGFVLEQNRPILVPEDIQTTYLEDWWKRSDENGSAVIAPIVNAGVVTGVVEIVRRSDSVPFAFEDVQWLSAWGKTAGEAMARFYQ